jgi:hypothetical protein
MSLQNIAQHLANQGRGKDTTLVHMTPNEVSGLAALARANGKEISVNPQTGLPEAGALESILAGLALNYIAPGFGGAIGEMFGLSGAAGTGLAIGAGTAAITGNIGKGFEAGFGAYTGAGLGESLAGLGMGELGREASSSAVADATAQKLEGEAYNKAIQDSVTNRMASATMADKYGAGLNFAGKNPMTALQATGKYLAPAALSIFADKNVNDVQTTTPQQKPNPGVYHPFTYDPIAQTMTPGQRYSAANGGLMSLANGGAVHRFDEGGLTLDQMYKNVLGREADTGGRDFWKSQFGDTVDDTELASFRQSALGGTDTADKAAAMYQPFGGAAQYSDPTANGFGAAAPVAPVAQDFGATSNNTGAMASVGNNVMGTGASGSSIEQNAVVNKATQAATEMAAPVRDARADEAAFTAAGNAANNTGIASLANTTGASNNVVSQQQGPLITDQVYDLFKNVLDRPPSESDMKYWATQFGINNNTIDPNEIADFKSAASKELAARTADFDSSKNYIPISKLDDLYMQELSRHGEYGKDGKEGGMEFWKRTFGDYINPEELAGFRTEAAKERAAREKATMPDVVTDLTKADPIYVKPGVGGSTGAGQVGGGTVINPNGTITTSPVIPGIPVGGFKGMEQVRDAYTTGGGKLGILPNYVPKTIAEFNNKYKNTGDSKAMYDYLMGKGPYPTTTGTADVDAAGKKVFREPSKVYSEVMGGPVNPNKQYNFNKETGKYETNPDYVRQEKIVDPTTKERSVINYMSINQAKDALKKTPLEGNALAEWSIDNFVDPATLAEATGMTINQINALLAKAKQDKDFIKKEGGLMSLAKGGLANGGLPEKERTNSVTGVKYYFDFKNGIYRPETTVKDGITYKWNPVISKYEKSSASGTGIASLVGGDGGSPAGGENPASRPEGSYDISSNINPYTGSINALANGPVGTAVGKIAGLFGPQVSLNNAPVEDGAGTLTQAGKDYGKSSWGKTGDEGQDIGTVAPKGSTSTTDSDVFASITRDVAARAAAAGMTTAEFAEKGLAEVSAQAQAELNDRPGGGGVAEGSYAGYDVGNAPSGDNAKGGYIGHYAQGGLGSLGGYSDGGRLLRGPGDGVSDSIPASIGNRQPARLADGEFVVPARIVSELGNGSTKAGARALYKMMARIQANRRKTTGKNSVAVDSKSHKYLPA